jgi:hypothetical protein
MACLFYFNPQTEYETKIKENDFYSLSSFIDKVFPGESRCRHFKRLETLRKYNIYDKMESFFVVNSVNKIMKNLKNENIILRKIMVISSISNEYEKENHYYDTIFYNNVRIEIEKLLKIEHNKQK